VSKHPVRTAIEEGASQDELAGLLTDDVVLMAPMLTVPVTGAAPVANVLASAARDAGPIEYTLEVPAAEIGTGAPSTRPPAGSSPCRGPRRKGQPPRPCRRTGGR
jgi:hypothetical protein